MRHAEFVCSESKKLLIVFHVGLQQRRKILITHLDPDIERLGLNTQWWYSEPFETKANVIRSMCKIAFEHVRSCELSVTPR